MHASQVTLVSFTFAHHGRYSSYHRLLHYSKAYRRVDLTPPLQGKLPWAVQRRLDARWRRWNEWRLWFLFKRHERQCVHYLYPENSLFRGNAWKRDHRLVLTCHQPGEVIRQMVDKPDGTALIHGLSVAERVVLLSSNFAADYRPLCKPDALCVIPHGVDIHHFSPPQKPSPNPLIITVGNWLRDFDFWADIAIRLGTELPTCNFAVVALPMFLGTAPARVEACLGARVRFLKDLTDNQLKNLYQEASLLFLPLRDAGANNALLESMACGLPTVVTDLAAAREYAGECALYFKPGDSAQCLCQLRRLLQEPTLRQELGAQSRRRAEQLFAWEIIANRYREVYAEVLQASPLVKRSVVE
jgi:glycosyltransferase involved in cell wall biosynthesis